MPISTFAKATPDRPALIFEPSGVKVTFGELEERSVRLANFLASEGLVRGDHIAVLMENHPRYMEVVLAALRSGLYVTAINRYMSAPEVAYILQDCGARAVVTSTQLAGVAAASLGETPNCSLRLLADGSADGFRSYDAAIAGSKPEVSHPTAGDMMLYSSGTTGRPKGIQRALADGPYQLTPQRRAVFANYGFGQDTVYLSPAPLYHAAPLGHVLGTLIFGGSVVVMEKYDSLAALALIERHRVTHSQWVPTMFVRMLKLAPEERQAFDLSSHRCAIHAAAPCPVEVKRAMIAWWGPIIEEYYASTEGIGATRINSADWLSHPGSVGRPDTPGSIRICGEDGRVLKPGETGVIYFAQSGPSFTYHNDEAKTAACQHPDHTNWLTVGDIGHLDEEGFLYLTDRKSFMIISGGVNIYPQAVEDALIMHPAVADVAVIGVPDAELGEVVKAIVELRGHAQGDAMLAAALLDFVRPHVARYALPRSVEFVDALPRLPTGKLYKKALRDRYWPAS